MSRLPLPGALPLLCGCRKYTPPRRQANLVRFGIAEALRALGSGVRMFFWLYLLMASRVGFFVLCTVNWGYSCFLA